jgi:hypothetical protein
VPGRSPAELAEEFEPSDPCIRNWVKQADRDRGKRRGLVCAGDRERPVGIFAFVSARPCALASVLRDTFTRLIARPGS